MPPSREELIRRDMGLKGSGDFSPRDPVECPENCEHLQEDGSCARDECIHDPEEAFWARLYEKYPHSV